MKQFQFPFFSLATLDDRGAIVQDNDGKTIACFAITFELDGRAQAQEVCEALNFAYSMQRFIGSKV